MTARPIECTNEEYHARDEFSRSQHTLVKDKPALYYGQEIKHTYPRPQKKDWDTGTVGHACYLEPGNIDNVVAIIPVDEFRTANGGIPSKPLSTNDYTEWKKAHPGIIHQTAEEFAKVQMMIDNVHAHPLAKVLYDHAIHFEYTIVWEDPETGLPLRIRPDMICRFPGGLYVPDYKTARGISEHEFRNDAAKYAYHRQAAMYSEGVEALFDEPVVAFPFLVSEKAPAYQCEVRTLPPRAVALGHEQNREIRRDLLRRIDEDDWHSESWGEARETDIAEWAYY